MVQLSVGDIPSVGNITPVWDIPIKYDYADGCENAGAGHLSGAFADVLPRFVSDVVTFHPLKPAA